MPKKPTSHRRPWTAKDMKVIKQFAKEKRTQREVAQALGRTPAAVQQKAFAEGIASEPGYWDAAAFAKDLAERTAYWGKVAANTAFERQ